MIKQIIKINLSQLRNKNLVKTKFNFKQNRTSKKEKISIYQ
jgi:hypothetical protein